MAWHIEADAVQAETAEDQLQSAKNETLGNMDTHDKQAHDDSVAQMDAGIEAVVLLIQGGTLGTAEAKYDVTMSGHANPGHVPDGDAPLDQVRIVVQQNVADPTPVEPVVPEDVQPVEPTDEPTVNPTEERRGDK